MPAITKPPARLQYGSLGFNGWVLPISLQNQTLNGVRTGPSISRAGREGLTYYREDDFSKGFYALNTTGTASWDAFKNRVYSNEGVMCHLPGLACLPYATTAQTSLAAVDISGYRAANLRLHQIMSTLGSSAGQRYYAFLGPNMYKDTSTSNPALVAPSTADNLTNNVLCTWSGRFNSTDYLCVGTDGQTDDTRGTTDPTANSVTWTELVTHGNANDRVWAGGYLKQYGFNYLIGTLNNTGPYIWCVKDTASIPRYEPAAGRLHQHKDDPEQQQPDPDDGLPLRRLRQWLR